MLYRKNSKTGEEISILGYGAMRLPQKGMHIDYDEAKKQLLYCIENGVNYLDTAWPYHNGESEKFLGKVLAEENLRNKVKIADKLPPWLVKNRDDMNKIFNKQLERLQANYIDYYLLHALDGKSWDKLKDQGVKSFLKTIKKNKTAINVGFSFHGPKDDFKRIVDEYDWDFCQIQYNILDKKNQAGKEGLEYAGERGLGVIIMEPLRGGNLAKEMPKKAKKIYDSSSQKRTNVEWALRWVWNHPEVLCVLSGMNNQEHIKENFKIAENALPNSLSKEELKIIDSVATEYRKAMKVPCTACQYCMPCPFGVNIPACFEHYNSYHMFGKRFMTKAMYFAQLGGTMTNGQTSFASQCVNCGKCVTHCPQNIEIPQELKKVKKNMEGFFTRQLMKIMMKMFSNIGKKELKEE